MEFLRNGIMAALGAVVTTKKKAKEVFDNLVDEGKITSKQADEMMEKLLASGQVQLKELEDSFKKAVENSIDELGLVRKQEFEVLANRVRELETALSEKDKD
jgi:polyhydroxyalkanoate synthesis regulator phasin